ncbi:hypothetical protein AB0E69_13080 [Kribbella sp. NPDC026611]|uniref:hypothetical protein n=1 Tax=Kribbella sp. NPDC026611 TaxID=3154911 RepID=UPI0033E4B60E
MRTLMTGPAWVAYGQIYVESTLDDSSSLEDCFAGQQNGLCGAAVPGKLFLITGLHTGHVGFTVELYDEQPPLDDTWEEIVEASYHPLGNAALVTWASDGGFWELDLDPFDYRLRYCAQGMDAGHQGAPPMDDQPLIDHYLLQLWPAPPAPDQVLKQTSAQAAYWHRSVREMPPQPSPAERAAAEQERQRLNALAQEAARKEALLQTWGGRLPSERVLATWHTQELAQLDRDLVDELDAADADLLYTVARWSARRACAAAGLDQTPWVAAALDLMDRGGDYVAVINPPAGLRPGGSFVTSTDWDPELSPTLQAMQVLNSTYWNDPLHAATATLWLAIGAAGNDSVVIAELRLAFPQLTNRAL